MNVALYGPQGAGKSFLANYLSEEFGYTRISFAEKMRLMLSFIAPEVRFKDFPKAQIIPRLGLSPRELMQSFGTWGRSVDPDFWLKAALDSPLVKMEFEREFVVSNDPQISLLLARRMLDIIQISDYAIALSLADWLAELSEENWRLNQFRVYQYAVNHGDSNVTEKIVIDDMRFDNEHDEIVKRGFLVTKIVPDSESPQADNHESEVDWKKWNPDLVFKNDRSERIEYRFNFGRTLLDWKTC
jgi:hypothetical protein